MTGRLKKEITASEESSQRAKGQSTGGAAAEPWPHAASSLLRPENDRAMP